MYFGMSANTFDLRDPSPWITTKVKCFKYQIGQVVGDTVHGCPYVLEQIGEGHVALGLACARLTGGARR